MKEGIKYTCLELCVGDSSKEVSVPLTGCLNPRTDWLTNLLHSFSLCVPGPRPGRGHVSVARALFPRQPWQEHHAEWWSANSAAHGQLQPRGGGVQSALASQPPAWGSIPLSANTRPAQCRIIFLFPRETVFFVFFFFAKHIIVRHLFRRACICPLKYTFHSLTQTALHNRVTFKYDCVMSLWYKYTLLAHL